MLTLKRLASLCAPLSFDKLGDASWNAIWCVCNVTAVILHVQDKITPAAGGRQTALAVLIIASILILLPMLPSGTDAAAVSSGTFL